MLRVHDLRLKVLLISTGLIAVFASITNVVKPINYFLIRCDYALWFFTFSLFLALYDDLIRACLNSRDLSVLMKVFGFFLALTTRVVSFTHSILLNPSSFYVGGGIADFSVLIYSAPLSIVAGLIVLNAFLLDWFRRDVSSLSYGWGGACVKLHNLTSSLISKLLKHYLIISFLTGFIVRLVPEVSWWPWLIGWDTVEYVAHLRDFVVSPKLFGTYYWMGGLRNIPPLLDWILYPFALAVDAWFVFKAYPPVLHGLLAAVTAWFSKKALHLSSGYAYLTALTTSLNILLLRMSWDLQKQVLCLPLFITALTILESGGGSPKRHCLVVALLTLSSLASEVGAGLTILISAYLIVENMVKFLSGRSLKDLTTTIMYSLLVGVAYTLIAWYFRTPTLPHPVLEITPPVVSVSVGEGPQAFAYFLITYGSLTPLLILGLDRELATVRRASFIVSTLLIMSLTPWISPHVSIPLEFDRLLMCATPIAIPIGLASLKILKRRYLAAVVVALLVMPGFYASANPFLHNYNSILVTPLQRMPPGLMPAPPSSNDIRNLTEVAEKVKHLNLSETPLLTHVSYGRFIHLMIRNPREGELILLDHHPEPEEVLQVINKVRVGKAYVLIPAEALEKFKLKSAEEGLRVYEVFSNKLYVVLRVGLNSC